jgi:peroxiredoxin
MSDGQFRAAERKIYEEKQLMFRFASDFNHRVAPKADVNE